MIKYWTPTELSTLRRLREGFISGTAGKANYWRSPEDLALYDTTFAERIGWKWSAALEELRTRGWQPQSSRIVDWGCGTGIAGRQVLAQWNDGRFKALNVFDRSTAAAHFAASRARAAQPGLEVRVGEHVDSDTLLLLSHVINELAEADLARLLENARRAKEVIWLEAGAREESRQLSAVREKLLGGGRFEVIAPCTHQAQCGMLTAQNERHWCHHFAHPPSEIFQDARWHQFSREMGIDLRSLPYSFLVLARPRPTPATPATPAGLSRVIGEPREFKGHDKLLCCQQSGLTELMLQKRDAPELLKAIRKGPSAPVYRWTLDGTKILAGENNPPNP